jgi:DNA-binding FadR family transcriptional regulator
LQYGDKIVRKGGKSAAPAKRSAKDITRAAANDELFPQRVIRIPKTADLVASHIRNLIIRGELKEGDFLQPEAQLMERFTTSRPTLREAFRILENERLISVTRGSRTGAQVHRPSVDNVARYAGFALQADGATLGDLYQVRLAIEPFAARLAATNSTKANVEKLRREAAAIGERLEADDVDQFIKLITRFHQSVVDISGNKTLRLMSLLLQGVIERHQSRIKGSPKIVRMKGENRAKLYRASMKSLAKLIDLIAAKDAAGAEAHWRSHVEAGNDLWVSGYDQTAIVDVLE